MLMGFTELDDNTRLITLTGRLDTIGTGEIERRFAGYCALHHACILVDLAGLDFLASSGIRLLASNAKSVSSRGGKMFLLSPAPGVLHLLDMSGIPAIIPIFSDLRSARAAFAAA